MPYIKVAPEEEVVISGIAGRFPDSASVEELKINLFQKKELIREEERWLHDIAECPEKIGKVPNLEKFDAAFFNVPPTKVPTIDPLVRTLLEHTYEAIVDAGTNPIELRGKSIAVVVGQCYSDTQRAMAFQRNDSFGANIMIGCHGSAAAMWISHWYGFKGPSYVVDTACSSSAFGLEQCYRLIKNGDCDAAIAAGCHVCLHPFASIEFSRLGVLSPDCRCRPFDADANGYVRSEAISAIFLQKAKDARRIYATLIHCKTNSDGFKRKGITLPSSALQKQLMEECYEECQVPPSKLAYVEAHATATKAGDPEEVLAIDAVMSKGRTTPLKIGSVKGNIGHTEPCSCLCSIVKVIIAMETGVIPPNINLNKVRDTLLPVIEGRFQIVTEATPWSGGYSAVNSFGFGGANCHAILKSNPKVKINHGKPNDDLPRLVAVSGCTAEAVASLLTSVENTGGDAEYIRLLHAVYALNIPNHGYRGYMIVSPKYPEIQMREIVSYDTRQRGRPIWFVFSGMGSHWIGMGKTLLKFPVFAKMIQKCDAVLKPHGIDILQIISVEDKSVLNNVVNRFVGIVAIQIGILDLLRAANIIPDKIIGQSIGELACAYADDCLTAEQVILAAYVLGQVSAQTKEINGSMALVKLGKKQLQVICPEDIDIACCYPNNSCITSGPVKSIRMFVKKLNASGIFAKELDYNNTAYHSRYMSKAMPTLLKYLQEIIPKPKERSAKWLSMSVQPKKWHTEEAMFASAEYFANNLSSSVFFEQTIPLIRKTAIIIEITPDELLDAVLQDSLSSEVAIVALPEHDCKDNIVSIMQGLGKLYNLGVPSTLADIFPPVALPVSLGTPMISHNIRWDHSADWYIAAYDAKGKIGYSERKIRFCVTDDSYMFMKGHVIDDRNMYPAAGYIFLVWDTFCAMMGHNYDTSSLVFEDVRFERATTLSDDTLIELTTMIHKGDGRFEVREGNAVVATGFVRYCTSPRKEMVTPELSKEMLGEEVLNTDDIYNELKIRGYNYQGSFKCLKSASLDAQKGHIVWQDNWVTFIDAMLQLTILGIDIRSLFVPTGIRKLVIDVGRHKEMVKSIEEEEKVLPVYVYSNFNTIVCGGIQISGAVAKSISRRRFRGVPVIEKYQFLPHHDNAEISLEEVIILSSQIALEIEYLIHLKALELVDDDDDISEKDLIAPTLYRILKELPLVAPKIELATSPDKYNSSLLNDIAVVNPDTLKKASKDYYLIAGYNLLAKEKQGRLQEILSSLKPNGFILTGECTVTDTNLQHANQCELSVILEKIVGKKTYLLLRKVTSETAPKQTHVMRVSSDTLDWVVNAQNILKQMVAEKKGNEELIFLTEGDRECGLLGFVNCLRREPAGEMVRAVLINDKNAPQFDLNDPFYAKQLKLNLPINILENGSWGTYRHLRLSALQEKPVQHVYIKQSVLGNLGSFQWIEAPITVKNQQQEVIHTMYGALNFRDVMFATGRLQSASYTKDTIAPALIGFEISGITSTGRRVMGLAKESNLSNLYLPEENAVFDVPDVWSLEDAATIPAVYGTCCMALIKVAKMKKGEKILIHSGSGGVGQAAINLALAEGCEVFTTVGTPEKRKFIRETFPAIDDNHIGNSRDTSFEQLILEQTNGRGVDIVLNSLAESKLLASVRCLARNGRFVEIGKYDIFANNPLGLALFKKEISFHSVMLDTIISTDPGRLAEIRDMFKTYIKDGRIKPIVRTVFEKNQFEAAIRYMATGKHIGKVLLKLGNEDSPLNEKILAHPQFYCLPNKSYIIFGGLGGIGLELARWLAERRAKHLLLISRNGLKSGNQMMKVELLRLKGVNVQIIKGKDGSDRTDCEYILKTAEDIAPVDGIFNLAVQLKDALFMNQTVQSFEESLRSKVGITKMLDTLSRKICPQLRYFVVFSSASCGRGTAGQTNYGYGNSVMERICERRVAEGLPGLAIQWGAVGDVGLVANMQKDKKTINISGTLPQNVFSCLEELEKFLLQDHPVVSSMVVAEKTRPEGVAASPLEAVLKIMGMKDVTSINVDTPLIELGMDSIVAVEIREILGRDFNVFLTASDMTELNIRRLIQMSNKQNDAENKETEKKPEGNIRLGFQLVINEIDTFEKKEDVVDMKVNTDKPENLILLLPGIDNSSNSFLSLSKQLKYNTCCLHYPTDDDYASVERVIEYLMINVWRKLEGVKKVVLAGYSYGSITAIEIARKIEAQGKISVKIVFLDGTPKVLKTYARISFPSLKEEDVYHTMLLILAEKFRPTVVAEIAKGFEKCSTLKDKLQEVFCKYITVSNSSEQNIKTLTTALLRRVYMIVVYDDSASPKLQSDITLLRATKGPSRNFNFEHGLEEVTKGKIVTMEIDAEHDTILESPDIGKVINDFLDEDEEKRN